MIKECSGCDNPAVGRIVDFGPEERKQLLCARCMEALKGDGVECEPLPVRLDVVARVKESIRSGQYDEGTLEGSLALNLATDKLIARQAQRERLPKCPWDGARCGLDSCRTKAGCYLDAQYAKTQEHPALHEQAQEDHPLCGHAAVPGHPTSVTCTRLAGHPLPHMSGWGPMALRWGGSS